jgi:hypothetical protein
VNLEDEALEVMGTWQLPLNAFERGKRDAERGALPVDGESCAYRSGYFGQVACLTTGDTVK